MNIDRAAADSLLAGAALLAFVASLAILDAVSASLTHLGWVTVTAGGAALTAMIGLLTALFAARAAQVPPDPQLLAVVTETEPHPPRR